MPSSNGETRSPSSSLIPVGLPASYIGGWAVAGIASLVYLSYAVNQPASLPGGSTLAPIQVAKKAAKPQPKVKSAPKKAAVQTAEAQAAPEAKLPKDLSLRTASRSNATSSSKPSFSAAAPQAEINTKYVTTQQILASRQPAQNASQEPVKQAAIPAPANTSNITTGSIKVPPLPQRAPARPAVIRTTLKPVINPTQLRKPAAAKRPAAAPAISFGPAVVKPTPAAAPAPTGLAVLLATGSSVESLRLTWTILQERHAAALLDLAPRYIVKDNPNAPERKFALLAGPVISANDIARVCAALQSEGLGCRTTTFAGNAL